MINITAPEKATAFGAIIAWNELRSAAPIYLDLAHHIPGRLRVRAAALKGDGRATAKARDVLEGITGVRAVMANPYAGSLTIEYDPKVLDCDTLVEALSRQGYIVTSGAAGPNDGQSTERLARAVGRVLVDTLAQHMAFAMVGALI
jgi:hypothetical protein